MSDSASSNKALAAQVSALAEKLDALIERIALDATERKTNESDVFRQIGELTAKQQEREIQMQNNLRDIGGTMAALVSYIKEPNVGPSNVDTIEAAGANIAAHKVGVDNQAPAALKAEIKRAYFIRMWLTDEEFRGRYESALPAVIPKPKTTAKKPATEDDIERAKALACFNEITKKHPALKEKFEKEHSTYKAGFTS
jgi:hypothetical protein